MQGGSAEKPDCTSARLFNRLEKSVSGRFCKAISIFHHYYTPATHRRCPCNAGKELSNLLHLNGEPFCADDLHIRVGAARG
jgi:hypothetical protein